MRADNLAMMLKGWALFWRARDLCRIFARKKSKMRIGKFKTAVANAAIRNFANCCGAAERLCPVHIPVISLLQPFAHSASRAPGTEEPSIPRESSW
jgi:hypothetical protein